MRLLIASLTVLLVTGACSGGSEPAAENTSTGGSGTTASVSAVDNEFDPSDLALTAGEEVTVTFTNDGETAHTFTSRELGFDTGTVEAGASADVTFTAPDGDTPFVCRLHEASDDMVGTITVK